MRTTPAKSLKLRGVCCVNHRFLLVTTPDHPEFIAKCPLSSCDNGICRIACGPFGAAYETDRGVDHESAEDASL